jgi:cytochrome c oxidase accessory protein FixG
VFLDFIHREFALFGLVFYPTDTVLLMLALISIILVVIIGTALLGRVWCGWACPQTVYLEFLFRPIERWIEGKEHIRKNRNEGPLTWDKVWRKGIKLTLFLMISLLLAHTFVAYFVGWPDLIAWMQLAPADNWGFFVMMAGTTGLILYNFGYFREQMCTITCPYARMQSIMIDPDSLIVSYDPNRGEPRSQRSKKKLRQETEGLIPQFGDCIDCGACVRTCPTGIDIRDGLQMECIACTQCVDACDAIMTKIEKPIGLIRYTSENELAGHATRIIRPRTILYATLFLAVTTLFVVALTTRSAYDITVLRSVGAPFTELPDGTIANRLRFRVHNQTSAASTFTIESLEPTTAKITVVGVSPITMNAEEIKRVEIWVSVPADTFEKGKRNGLFRLQFDDGFVTDIPFPLLGPSL